MRRLKHMEDARRRMVVTLGCYMCICPKESFSVLESIMKESVLGCQYIRKSYIQEVLNSSQKEYVSRVLVRF